MLVIRVEYLLGRVFAGNFGDRAQPEWPPHPSRLFSALTAAYHRVQLGERARQALLWLERQEPPSIHASLPGQASIVTAFVPTNYVDSGISNASGVVPARRKKQPRTFANQSPASDVVHFMWEQAEVPSDIAAAFHEIAGYVGYLGTAKSPVTIAVTEYAPSPTFIPDPSGQHVLRVPGEGRLNELERSFNLNRWAPTGPQCRYREESGKPTSNIARGVFAEMVIFRKTAGVRLTIDATMTVSASLRAALVRVAEDHGVLTEMLHGHGAHPHCAYAPLSFVGHPHADGRLLGFALILPGRMTLGERQKVMVAAGHLKQLRLPGELGLWHLDLMYGGPGPLALQPSLWTQPSLSWSTVTPISLDQFPKQKPGHASVAAIIAASCEHVGLPRPVAVEHSPYSPLSGVPPVPQFRLRRRHTDPARWAVHATVTFDQPVEGPILLGAGRYFGMGFMRPQSMEGAS